MTITCQNKTENGLCKTLVMIIIYVLFLILPIISLITLIISGMFFLYYWAGVIVFCYNKSQLGDHSYTEKMVPACEAPPFDTKNEFFLVKAEQTVAYYRQNNRM